MTYTNHVHASIYLWTTYYHTYPRYLHMEIQDWLPRWNTPLTQFGFIHNWIVTSFQCIINLVSNCLKLSSISFRTHPLFCNLKNDLWHCLAHFKNWSKFKSIFQKFAKLFHSDARRKRVFLFYQLLDCMLSSTSFQL